MPQATFYASLSRWFAWLVLEMELVEVISALAMRQVCVQVAHRALIYLTLFVVHWFAWLQQRRHRQAECDLQISLPPTYASGNLAPKSSAAFESIGAAICGQMRAASSAPKCHPVSKRSLRVDAWLLLLLVPPLFPFHFSYAAAGSLEYK